MDMCPRHVGGRYPTPGFLRPLNDEFWSGRGDSNSRSRAPEARAFNQARPLPEIWWLVTELNRVHRLFRPALYRRVHEPKSGGRCETRTRISRVQAVGNPLIRTAHWGEMRESNSRDWSHNPVPKPFGQSRHQIWSWSSESNTRRRGTSSLHCHCARPANFWSWHAASNCGRALTMRLLFPLSYTSGAGAAIRTPITDLRGPRSSH